MSTTTKKNKFPIRRCLVSGEQLPKSQLIRIVRTPLNQLEVDKTGKKNGRGAYIKRDPVLLTTLMKSHLIEKHLGVLPNDAFYSELKKVLDEK